MEYNSRNHISNLECFRPREMSSKHPARTENLTVHSRKAAPRDPRFDSLCGSFNEKVFFILLFWYSSSVKVCVNIRTILWQCRNQFSPAIHLQHLYQMVHMLSVGHTAVSCDAVIEEPVVLKFLTKNVKCELRFHFYLRYSLYQASLCQPSLSGRAL